MPAETPSERETPVILVIFRDLQLLAQVMMPKTHVMPVLPDFGGLIVPAMSNVFPVNVQLRAAHQKVQEHSAVLAQMPMEITQRLDLEILAMPAIIRARQSLAQLMKRKTHVMPVPTDFGGLIVLVMNNVFLTNARLQEEHPKVPDHFVAHAQMPTEIIRRLDPEIPAMLVIIRVLQLSAQLLKPRMHVMPVPTDYGNLMVLAMNDAYQINIDFYGEK